MYQELVVILDANRSMGEEIHNNDDDEDDDTQQNDFLGTTKFDVARYMVQELLLLSGKNDIRILALVILGADKETNRTRMEKDDKGVIIEMKGGCCCCYNVSKENNHHASSEWIQEILESIHPSRKGMQDSDFVTGIVMATTAMLSRTTTTTAGACFRLVLVTDARHKVLGSKDNANHHDDPMEALVDAVNRLHNIRCTLEVVGIGFQQILSNQTGAEQDSEEDDESDGTASSEAQDDRSDIQEQNELLIMDLVEKLGGGVQVVHGGDDYYYCVERVLERLGLQGSKENNEIPAEIGVKKERVEDVRDTSSLYPDRETQRIHWNGSDDVLLPEWIKTVKPSCWSGSVDSANKCLWIQIDDPLSEQGVTFSNCQEKNYCSGHWLVDCTLEHVDGLWEKIAVATAYGKLGPTAKVSSTKHLLQRNTSRQTVVTIHVRVHDFTNRADIKRIFDVLNKDLNIHSNALSFQTDAFVRPEVVCEKNREQHSNCLYTVEEVFSL